MNSAVSMSDVLLTAEAENQYFMLFSDLFIFVFPATKAVCQHWAVCFSFQSSQTVSVI